MKCALVRPFIAAGTVAALAACAVGPSTRMNPSVPSVGARASADASADTRAFLDSLRTARASDRGDSLSRITSQLPRQTVELSRDATTMPAWSDLLRDSALEGLIRIAVTN
ncbi:MAG TPA: hypothetical protein VGE27_01240, partial [Gemmatimonas sp.]|uniref:hypothetical protein n=1 Tax=Gemmatimonas sp. TaxID=1962908 RepID=UPI002EDB7289